MTTMSLRIPDDQARVLKALALAQDTSASEIVRTAIGEHIDRRRAERRSQRRLRGASERSWEVFDLVAG
jgi:predicted transcriptional regulator